MAFFNSFGKDKYVHFIVSLLLSLFLFAGGLFLGLGTCAIVPAILGTAAFGIGKEFYDKKHTGLFDKSDLVADFLGCFLGIVIIALIVGGFGL